MLTGVVDDFKFLQATAELLRATTAEFGVSLPGILAQPPFSMIARRSQDEELLANSSNFVDASACCRNLSTQIGASTSTTAVCARSFAIRSAVLPSVHPKDEKPITDIATAPITAPRPLVLDSDTFSFIVPRCQGKIFLLIFPPRIAALREDSSAIRQGTYDFVG
jgi:hypothetical protein